MMPTWGCRWRSLKETLSPRLKSARVGRAAAGLGGAAVVTTDSKHHLPVAPDLVQRRFTPAAPNLVWSGAATSPTCSPTRGGLYLAAVLDLHSRQVVGCSPQPHMQTALVKDALLMACFRRRPAAGLIFHSDRGSQYCSHDFQDTLQAWGIRSSMSRKGNCWDNAPTESLWLRLKTTCVHGRRFATREQVRQAVMDWIAFYNRRTCKTPATRMNTGDAG